MVSEPVVVTGVGVVTALGFGMEPTWARLLAGDSGIVELPAEKLTLPVKLPVRLGAPVIKEELAVRIRAAVPRGVWNTSAEVCHAWLLAALEAWAMAGLPRREAQEKSVAAALDPERVGIYVGNGAGAASFIEQEYANVYTAEKAVNRDISRMAVVKYMASSLAGQLSLVLGTRGPSLAVNTACSSGATALVLALDALRLGRVDRALAGGADLPLTASVLKGFANLGALSANRERGARASRPFDAGRDGFVLGEGAACLVLERASAAAQRGARPLARLRGGAATSEAHSLLAPQEDGVGMQECLALALADAGVTPQRVRHVYAHGTGTRYNDQCEAAALLRLLGRPASVSATKAQLGHTLGAAGAVDAALAVRGLTRGQAVPCTHLEQLDPDCPVQPALVPDLPVLAADDALLVNSFAFGGHNVTLVLAPAA